MKAVAYFRTSSATNVGTDKDSLARQRDAVIAYAASAGHEIVKEFYDAAVSGADRIDDRPGFSELLHFCDENDVKVILIETVNRFARTMIVQLTGHELLQQKGITLVPADAPEFFETEDPMKVAIQQIMGVIAQLEKSMLVAKLRHARDRKRAKTGRCEGRKPAPTAAIELARRVRVENPQASLRQIAKVLEADGHLSPSGRPYLPGSIAAMLKEDNK